MIGINRNKYHFLEMIFLLNPIANEKFIIKGIIDIYNRKTSLSLVIPLIELKSIHLQTIL